LRFGAKAPQPPFAKSKHQVTAVQAAKLRARLRSDIVPVGVFVNAPVEAAAALYRDGVTGIAQLHGNEDSNYIAALKEKTALGASGPVLVIKAVRVESREDILKAARIGADYLLLDHVAGGTGKSFDWTLLQDGEFLGGLPIPCFLAGALTGIIMKAMKDAIALPS
jgi:phosphoribosylanthranilate isomerase